jgi:hypothetical protein
MDASPEDPPPDAPDPIVLALQSQEARLARLEEEGNHKGLFKKLVGNAGTVALLLGLVLTARSIYDVFVTRPEADRIERLSKFNEVVNSVAKKQQDMMQLVGQAADPKMQLTIASAMTPQVLNDLSTAQAMLRDLDDKDVGIPQLIVLMNAAATEGDWPTVKSFVNRAVSQTDVTPYLRSEAKRFEGKYWFMSGDAERGHQSYQDAVEALGPAPVAAAARAFDLGDLVATEYTVGACPRAAADFSILVAALRSPFVAEQARMQIAASVIAQVTSAGRRCPTPDDLAALRPE